MTARDTLRELVGLVLPVACAGCGLPDVAWCDVCEAALRDVDRREAGCPRLDRLDGAPLLPVWTAARYAGPVRRAVPAWKDGGRADLTPVMVRAVRRAAGVAGARLGAAGVPLWVVPVPPRAAAVRRRGGDLVAVLADAVADELAAAGAVRARRLLVRRGTHAQAALGSRARGANAAAYALRRSPGPGARCLLVDDVVTTGATLAACEDALVRAGAVVLGAVAVAATPGITRSALLVPARAG